MRTVAGELERSLSKVLDEPIKITAAGRTDTGVHATGQVISFKTSRSFPFERLRIALNNALPSDLSVREAGIAPENFSARFSAVERTYVYAILNRRYPSALLSRLTYRVWTPMDLEAFNAAAQPLIGEHDFRSFCGMLPESGPTVRELKSLRAERRGELVRVEIIADGFLHRMARTLVGTLVECAVGRRDPARVADLLAARAREATGHTAPAQGLYLAGVRYTDGYQSFGEPAVFSAV